MNTTSIVLISFLFGAIIGIILGIILLRPYIGDSFENDINRLVQKGRGNTNTTTQDLPVEKKERKRLFKRKNS